jgi:GT2 family glycosyltransferase
VKYPFISIIIPTWRKNQILNNCLDSLLVQDYPKKNFEIILVAKKKISTDYKIVRSIVIKDNINHAQARNIGVKSAKGTIIAFCDDDCTLPKDWLSKAVGYFTRKKVDLIGGPVVPPQNAPFKYRLAGYLAGSKFTVGFAACRHRSIIPEQEANEFDLILANTFIRKEVFEEFGGFDKNQVPCEENFLYSKLKEHGYKLLYSPKIACTHPAKPIFFPWAKKVFFYATGRGLLIARAPETFHFQYFIPSIFIISITVLALLSIYNPIIRIFLIFVLLPYLILTVANSLFVIYRFERNPLILLIAPISTFIIHWSYGLGFLNGLISYLIGKRKAVKMPSKY